jgi:hypothetical protein
MTRLYVFVLIVLLTSCLKKSKQEDYIITCPGANDIAWLNTIKASARNNCGLEFRYGLYNETPVIEVRSPGPACDVSNVVYNMDGIILLSSADQASYNLFLTEVKDTCIFWSCRKNAGN